MPSAPIERGEPSRAVAANVRAVRERRRLGQQQLSDLLAGLGRPIPPTALSKVEAGERRVDADDLVALAVALNVSPTRLLLPDGAADDQVELTPALSVDAAAAWEWATDRAPLPTGPGAESGDTARAYRDERPGWLRAMSEHPVYNSIEQRLLVAGRMIRELANEQRPDRVLGASKALDFMWEELQDGYRSVMEKRAEKRGKARG